MALENGDKIKDLFSSKLQNFDPEVPTSIWLGIGSALSQLPPIPDPATLATTTTKTVATTAKITVWKVVAAVAATVAIISGSIFFFTGDAEKAKDIPLPVTEIVEEVVTPPVEVEEVEEVVPPVYIAKKEPKIVVQEEPVVIPVEEVEEEVVQKKDQKLEEFRIVEDWGKGVSPPDVIIEKPKRSVTLGFLARADLYDDHINQEGRVLSFSDDQPLDGSLYYGNNKYRMQHNRPISFGVMVSKELSEDLAIETGLVYTYLSSSIKSDDYYKIREKQKFHYLGIPISLNYTFLEYKKLDSYISVGGMVQKDIYGTYEGVLDRPVSLGGQDADVSYPSFQRLARSKKSIHQHKLQFSTHFNIGVSYPVYNKLYLYGTFGGTYYFDASDKYRTIYSDKEFQLDLNLGLKWKF